MNSLRSLSFWTLFFLTTCTYAQTPDTLAAAQLMAKAEQSYKSALWEDAIAAFGAAAVSWKASQGTESDSLLWARYFYCKRLEAYAFHKSFRYLEADSAFQSYFPELIALWGKQHPEYGKALYYAAWAVYRGKGPGESLPMFFETLEVRKSYLPADDPGLAEVLNDIARRYDDMGEYEKALIYYEQTIPFYLASNHEEMLASNYNLMGWIHREFDRLEAAVPLYLQAIALFRKVDPEGSGLNYCLSNLALAYLDLSQYQKALDCFREPLPYYQKMDEVSYAVGLINIALTYNLMGDYQKAIEYNLAALPLFESLKQDYYLASNLLTLGITYQDLGKDETALFYFEKALAIFRELEDPKIGVTLSEMSRLYLKRNEWELALRMAQAAYESEVELEITNPMHAEYLTDIGNAYRSLGKYPESLQHYAQAMEVIEAFPENPYVEVILRNRGIAYDEMGQEGPALASFQQVFFTNVPGFVGKDPFQHPPFEAVPRTKVEHLLTLKAKAQAFQHAANGRMNYLMAADTCYQLAVYLAEQIRHSYRSENSKLLLQGKQQDLFSNAFSLCLQLYEKGGDPAYLNRALSLSEKPKTMVLYEMIQARQAREFADLPAEVSEREAALRTDLNHLTELIFDWEHSSRSVDSTELAQLKTQLFSQQQAHDSLLSVLEQAYPGYSQLKQTRAIVNPQLIQARLKEDEALLSYVSQDSVLGVFVFTQDGFDYVSLPMGGHLAADIQAYRTALQSPSMAYDVFSPLSYQLYQLLVAPVSQLIEGKRLIISPDGSLATIPFESLLTEPSDAGTSYAAAPFLIRKHQLSYTYSATFWVEEQTQLAPNRETLAFAPSFNERRNDSPSEENLLALASTDTIRGNLSGLRGTRKEVEEMSQFLSVKSFVEDQATEAAFKALAGEYGMLHLATHAIIDNENPLNSRLLFSIGQDSSEDGDLHVWELYQLDLHAQLAVLSACNTGYGKLQRGEGVMSLGRAFAYAGVPSIVMSLWPAEDESTADLMGFFYQNLADGMSKDEALQAAKLQFLKEADPIAHHPFYWAGFVVQGEAGPLVARQLNWWWALLAGLLLVVVGVWWRRR